MLLLSLTLETPAENVALDEALLDASEANELPAGGVLRLWESPVPMVVVGRGSRLADEVDLANCRRKDVPVLRRASGGMAIVAGPGCLMYAVVLPHPAGSKANIDTAHRLVLATMVDGLQQAGLDVQAAGTSDLAIRGDAGILRKVSGNSLRLGRTALLYHGTLLYDFDLSLVSRYLRHPPRSPDYRAGRGHDAFVANLPIDRASLARAVANAWGARNNLTGWPRDRVQRLVEFRYARDDWNLER